MIKLAATVTLLLAAVPALPAVFEVGDDGAMVRLDVPVAAAVLPARRRPASPSMAARALAFRPDVDGAARSYQISPALIDAIARVESRYDPKARSSADAAGIMQLMPRTARAMGVERTDPAANIRGGTAYLRLLLDRFDGDVVRTIAAYNAGPAAVSRAGGIPRFPETVAYVGMVMDNLAAAAQ